MGPQSGPVHFLKIQYRGHIPVLQVRKATFIINCITFEFLVANPTEHQSLRKTSTCH